jgi:hypothetical protein
MNEFLRLGRPEVRILSLTIVSVAVENSAEPYGVTVEFQPIVLQAPPRTHVQANSPDVAARTFRVRPFLVP